MGNAKVTVVVPWVPELSVRCGTRVARPRVRTPAPAWQRIQLAPW
jgi:hypothetical protein